MLLREISDLQIVILILARSAWSRAITVPMEIGDISEEESMKYLIEKRNINEEMAKELYQLVGGRILELKTLANDILAGQSFEGKNYFALFILDNNNFFFHI